MRRVTLFLAALLAGACADVQEPVAPTAEPPRAATRQLTAPDGDCSDYTLTFNDFERRRDLYVLVVDDGTDVGGRGTVRVPGLVAELIVLDATGHDCQPEGYPESATVGGVLRTASGAMLPFQLELISHGWPESIGDTDFDVAELTVGSTTWTFEGELHHEPEPLI